MTDPLEGARPCKKCDAMPDTEFGAAVPQFTHPGYGCGASNFTYSVEGWNKEFAEKDYSTMDRAPPTKPAIHVERIEYLEREVESLKAWRERLSWGNKAERPPKPCVKCGVYDMRISYDEFWFAQCGECYFMTSTPNQEDNNPAGALKAWNKR